MSTTDSDNWLTDVQIKEQEFQAGYEQEGGRGGLRPEERNDGRDDPIEHDHMEGTSSETTMYATPDNPPDWYDPHESLPSCERHSTRGAKYTRLWTLNAGRDKHHAKGKTYADDETHKVSQPTRDRARFVHAVANRCCLSRGLTARCTSVARCIDPRKFNYWGGMDVFILAIVAFVAVTCGDRCAWSGDLENFHAIREQWDVGIDDLGAAIKKVDEETTIVRAR